MRKFCLISAFLVCGGLLFGMVRAGVNIGPDGYYYSSYYDDGYYYDTWYGPGYYYGYYYDDYPTYYAWRRNRWQNGRHWHGGHHGYRR